MKVAIYGISTVATLLLFTGGFIYNNHKIPAVWVLFSSIVAYALSFALYWQREIRDRPEWR